MAWSASDHHPLVELAPNLWTVEADLARVPFRRRMVVVRLSTGELVIHSAIALDGPSMARLEDWGKPAYLIVPNPLHRMDAPAYAERYPGIEVIAPAKSRAKIEKKVAVTGDFDRLPDDPALAVAPLEGGKLGEAALLVTSDDGVTAVFCDALFNVVETTRGGFGAWMIRRLGSVGGPRVTWLARRAIVGDKAAFADSLRAVAATPNLVRLVPGHGDVIDSDAAAVLTRVAGDLFPPRG